MKFVAIAISVLFATATLSASHSNAEGYCPNQPNGKCPQAKKASKNRSNYSAEQREKFMEQARQVCKKKYGASASVYRLDYKKWTVICMPPGM